MRYVKTNLCMFVGTGPDGPKQLRAGQHDDLRGVAGRVRRADPSATPVERRRRRGRVARRGRRGSSPNAQGALVAASRRLPAVARLARPALHALQPQLLPAAGPARLRDHLGWTLALLAAGNATKGDCLTHLNGPP